VTITPNSTDARYGAPSSYSVAAVQDPSKACLITSPATSCEITGLANATSYNFIARANLNSWQTASSPASATVVPTPEPTPEPTPGATIKVSSVKQKVARKSAYLTSRVTVSGAGKISQRATTGSKKLTTRCRVTKTTSSASTHTLKCNLGSKGRRALKRSPLKLTLRTIFTPATGNAVTSERSLTIKRRR
jgi:hypothetical protein